MDLGDFSLGGQEEEEMLLGDWGKACMGEGFCPGPRGGDGCERVRRSAGGWEGFAVL